MELIRHVQTPNKVKLPGVSPNHPSHELLQAVTLGWLKTPWWRLESVVELVFTKVTAGTVQFLGDVLHLFSHCTGLKIQT